MRVISFATGGETPYKWGALGDLRELSDLLACAFPTWQYVDVGHSTLKELNFAHDLSVAGMILPQALVIHFLACARDVVEVSICSLTCAQPSGV